MRHTQHRCLGVPRCASVCEQQEEPLGQLQQEEPLGQLQQEDPLGQLQQEEPLGQLQQEEPLGQLEEPLANSRLRVALSL